MIFFNYNNNKHFRQMREKIRFVILRVERRIRHRRLFKHCQYVIASFKAKQSRNSPPGLLRALTLIFHYIARARNDAD
jgi:hypothetical protein